MAAWSPASRCASFDVARQRADVMVTVGKHGKDTDSGNAAYFGMMAVNLLAGWLHAAAISGRSMDDVLTWALDERNDEPVKILRDHPAAASRNRRHARCCLPQPRRHPLQLVDYHPDRHRAAARPRRPRHLRPAPRRQYRHRRLPARQRHHLPPGV